MFFLALGLIATFTTVIAAVVLISIDRAAALVDSPSMDLVLRPK